MKRSLNPEARLCLQAWLAENSPVHVLVDGANVALYGQNWEHGGFSFGQIKGVMDELANSHPELHPLMVRNVCPA